MAWLRRKVTQINTPPPVQQQTQIVPAARPVAPSTTPNNVITIVSQRVVETWEQGELTRQTVERAFWRREG